MKKIIYGLLISLALVAFNFYVVLADSDSPDCTDTPQLPPTETNVPPPTETRLPPPTETMEPTPTSPPPPTETNVPLSEPTPTIEVDPTPTETVIPGVTVTPDKPKKPTPTWDCIKYPDNQEKCLAHTGGGLPANVNLGLLAIATVILVFVIVLARRGRNA